MCTIEGNESTGLFEVQVIVFDFRQVGMEFSSGLLIVIKIVKLFVNPAAAGLVTAV